MPTNKKNKSRSKAPAKQASSEPYAFVNSPDGIGAYVLNGVMPLPDGGYTHYVLSIRAGEGIRDGFIRPWSETDSDIMTSCSSSGGHGGLIVRISCPEALVLFVEPMLSRTPPTRLPSDAREVLRWWQKQRRPGPVRYQELVMPLLDKEQLQKIAEWGPAMAFGSFTGPITLNDEATPLSTASIVSHRHKFQEHYYSRHRNQYATWRLPEGVTRDLGLPNPEANDIEPLIQRWVECAPLLQCFVQIAGHMRLLYYLKGDSEASALWNTEVEIQVRHCRFLESGMAQCVASDTIVFARDYPTRVKFGLRSRFFGIPKIEKSGTCVMKALGAWLASNTDDELVNDTVFNDFLRHSKKSFRQGVQNSAISLTQIYPTCDPYEHVDDMTDILYSVYIDWERLRLRQSMGPLACTPHLDDPPKQDLEKLHEVLRRTGIEHQDIEAAGLLMVRCLWNAACLTAFPELFYYPQEAHGNAVRRESYELPVDRLVPIQRTFEEALPICVMGLCSCPWWLDTFSRSRSKALQKYLTVTISNSSEAERVELRACPYYFSKTVTMEGPMLSPSASFLDSAGRGDTKFITSAFLVIASDAPRTTYELLRGVVNLAAKLCRQGERDRLWMEENRKTSTTKKERKYCGGCGMKEAKEASDRVLRSCTRCHLVRYCSVDCQRKHWKLHRMVCRPIVESRTGDAS